MDHLLQDLRYAMRSLRRTPGFALLTIMTLALGIGANTAIFSVVNGVVLRPLQYPAPARLMFITSQFPTLGFDQFWISAPEFIDFRDRNQAFESVGAYTVRAANLGIEVPTRPTTAIITHDLMTALGVAPIRGRAFTREDTLPNAEDVAILSYELWNGSFGRDDGVVGRVVEIDGVSTRIVGVMPRGYDVHDQRVELWLPLTLDPANPGNRGGHFLYLIGRLKPGVTIAQARADLETQLASWQQVAPKNHVPNTTTHRFRIDPLQDDIIGSVKAALWILQGAVGFVLLIACANLANLLLARGESRQKEFAVRTALGASRRRMLRQFLTEGVVLALAGGAIGVGLAVAGLRALLAANPNSIPRAAEISLDPVVLAFTFVVAIATGLLFGLAPLLHLSVRSMHISLKEAGARTTAGTARARTRNALVVAEVALAVVLVIGAGLLLRSFWNLMRVDAGFDRGRLTTFRLVLPGALYQQPPRRVAFFRELIAKVRAIPGVQGAAAMTGLPPRRQVNANDTAFESVPEPPNGPAHNVDYYQFVTVDYLTTMGIPVLEGRPFTEGDATGAPAVVVNEKIAKLFYSKQSAIGRRVQPSLSANNPWFTIVGVVKDVKQGGVNEKTGTELYLLADQMPATAGFAPGNMNLVVRSALPFESLAPQLRTIVRSMDARLPIVGLRTMEEVFAESVARPRFLLQLLGIFAGLALLLAAVGTYGILSYSVSERQHEIGIRMALGASRGTVLGMVLGHGLKLTLAGLVLGLAGAFWLTRLMQTLLFDVRPTDPVTLVAVAAFIALVAIAACLVPARRATKVDPMQVLRQE